MQRVRTLEFCAESDTHTHTRPQQTKKLQSDGSDQEMCWICLEEESESGDNRLMAPCKCPRKVHPQCLARWQLQQAGRHEEKSCR